MLDVQRYTIADRRTINVSFTIYYCGSQTCQPGEEWSSKVIDHYLLCHILEGKGKLYTKGKTFYLSKGQGFLVSPEVLTSFVADEEEPWSYAYVAFAGHLVDTYLFRAQLTSSEPTYTYLKDDYLDQRFNQIIEHSKLNYNRYCKMMAELFLIVSKLIDHSRSEYFGTANLQDPEYYTRKAMIYIEMHYHKKLNVEDIARYLGITRKHFYHIFKEAVNMSPQEYIIIYRIRKASNLMESSNLSISEIARSVGYTDQFHFSKMFKRVMGISPSEYKKEAKECWTDEEKYKNRINSLLRDIMDKNEEIIRLKQELYKNNH